VGRFLRLEDADLIDGYFDIPDLRNRLLQWLLRVGSRSNQAELEGRLLVSRRSLYKWKLVLSAQSRPSQNKFSNTNKLTVTLITPRVALGQVMPAVLEVSVDSFYLARRDSLPADVHHLP